MESRKERYGKRRLKKPIRRVLWAIVILIVLIIGYSVFQYFAGKSAAEDEMGSFTDSEKLEQFSDDFQGADSDGPMNVLLVGTDSDDGSAARTDTIMIGQFDPSNNEAKLVSIMRDSLVTIPGHGQQKINAAFAIGGPELLRQTLKENFDVDVEHYAMINLKGFENIVDTVAPGGVTINVEKNMEYASNDGRVDIDLEAGEHSLDGASLLDYARFRSDAEADFGRVRRQQQVMSELKDEVLSFAGVMRLPRAAGAFEPYVNTDMSTFGMASALGRFMMNTPDEIQTMRIPVEGGFRNARYSGVGAVLELNMEQNREALQEFLND
ncbi:LCP family protein required for cell wall assembly [Alkalibacillus flavidus]|uniref:Regulatory protein MsrR n=1 Tax=Alkalibacillus flavidus TaxID=546021 RepID=A0ABV2KZW4_9BACI